MLPPRHLLSKSTFMYGNQCSKRLWLHKFKPNLRDEMEEEQAAIFQRGTDVGILARELFPGGIDAAPATPFEYQQSVVNTARYIQEGHKIIYEAAFQYEGLLCAIDILVKKAGKWYGYEVKSSTSAKDPSIMDACYQHYVIQKSGLTLENIYVTHLNSGYIRNGELDLKRLFHHHSVKELALEIEMAIEEKALELKSVLKLGNAPEVKIGKQCNNPYPCDFKGYCHQDEPEPAPKEKFINSEAIEEFLEGLQYPLRFMDFETWSSAIPECDGHWSYKQIPFQFSMHTQLHPHGDLDHVGWLANHPHDELDHFIQNLLEAADSGPGSILVYNKAFENGILSQLKKDFPALETAIDMVQDRIVDLMAPFRKNYRLPEMNGSYSIKQVLPALVPDMNYEGLAINNGTDASTSFYNLQFEMDQQKINEVRKNLLDYCGLDTLAMVKILEKLASDHS